MVEYSKGGSELELNGVFGKPSVLLTSSEMMTRRPEFGSIYFFPINWAPGFYGAVEMRLGKIVYGLAPVEGGRVESPENWYEEKAYFQGGDYFPFERIDILLKGLWLI